MNGPEHYTAAEQLLLAASGSSEEMDLHDRITAQVHATLALTAAIADHLVRQEAHNRSVAHETGIDLAQPLMGTWAGVIRTTIGDQA